MNVEIKFVSSYKCLEDAHVYLEKINYLSIFTYFIPDVTVTHVYRIDEVFIFKCFKRVSIVIK